MCKFCLPTPTLVRLPTSNLYSASCSCMMEIYIAPLIIIATCHTISNCGGSYGIPFTASWHRTLLYCTWTVCTKHSLSQIRGLPLSTCMVSMYIESNWSDCSDVILTLFSLYDYKYKKSITWNEVGMKKYTNKIMIEQGRQLQVHIPSFHDRFRDVYL